VYDYVVPIVTQWWCLGKYPRSAHEESWHKWHFQGYVEQPHNWTFSRKKWACNSSFAGSHENTGHCRCARPLSPLIRISEELQRYTYSNGTPNTSDFFKILRFTISDFGGRRCINAVRKRWIAPNFVLWGDRIPRSSSSSGFGRLLRLRSNSLRMWGLTSPSFTGFDDNEVNGESTGVSPAVKE